MSTAAAATDTDGRSQPSWNKVLAPYARPRVARSVQDVLTSAVPYVALLVLMYLALDVSYLLVLALALPAAGFLLRTYIVFHDCTHGSFMPTKRANKWVGVVSGLLVFECFENWKRNHWIHHGTSGDLDRRGAGDVQTLTLAEYRALSPRGRLAYRLFRNPFVMFTVGPLYSLVIHPRFVLKGMRPRIRNAVIATNVALAVLVTALCLLVGWQEYLLVQLPPVMIAGAVGIWMFYVQHQYEDAYWESSGAGTWDYTDSALRGASYLKLPKVLQFFSGNIGLHHVHHLSAQIPNYNLQRAHDENPVFHQVPVLSVADALRAVHLKVWDEDRGRLIGWAEARERPEQRSPATA